MKKIVSALLCLCMAITMTACGKKSDDSGAAKQGNIELISPDTLITAETATIAAGVDMKADGEVVLDGIARSITYVTDERGAGDPISIRIEQFSDSLTVNQVWSDYENNRVRRSDSEFVQGIGEDCYIAYPYICVFDRGCFIKITAGSGDGQEQRECLVSLATQAATAIENLISEDAVNDAKGNVIK